MKNTMLVIGLLLVCYAGWQLSKDRNGRGQIFYGPARFYIPLIGIALFVVGLLL